MTCSHGPLRDLVQFPREKAWGRFQCLPNWYKSCEKCCGDPVRIVLEDHAGSFTQIIIKGRAAAVAIMSNELSCYCSIVLMVCI